MYKLTVGDCQNHEIKVAKGEISQRLKKSRFVMRVVLSSPRRY